MRVERIEKFQPLVITIETEEELRKLRKEIGSNPTSPDSICYILYLKLDAEVKRYTPFV